MAFSPDGALLASASEDKTVRLWNARTWEAVLPQQLRRHTLWVTGVAFSADGSLLASASGDRTVQLWSPQTWQPTGCRVLHGHTDWLRSVAFSPDGTSIASASDKTVRLYNSPVQSSK